MTWLAPTEFPQVPPDSIIAVDTETYCEDLQKKGPQFIVGKDYPIGISLAMPGYKQYFPIAHREGNCNLTVVAYFKELLDRQDIIAVGANTRFDLEALWKIGIEPKCKLHDIQVTDSLLDENQMSYSLQNIAKRRGFPGKKSSEMEQWMIEHGLIAKGKPDYSRMPEVPPYIIGPYAEEDAALTLEIFAQQITEILDQDLKTVFELEGKLIPILFQMRLHGCPVDVKLAEQRHEEMNIMLKEDWKQFPAKLDPWSSQSLSKWIIDTFQIAVPQTEKGNDSVANEWLMATGIPELIALANWRKANKINRDFIKGMVIDGNHNGILHPNWFQTRGSSFMSGDDVNGTRSGRIACTDPNLTTAPNRHKIYGPILRSLFVPRNGERWCKADFASQEPRISLHYACLLNLPGAEEIRQLYLKDPTTSFHKVVMAMVNEIRDKPIDYRQAKDINLGLAYGMGKVKMAKKLNMSVQEVIPILDDYDRRIPFMRQLLKEAMHIANQRGYVKTILGRRRRFNEWENAEFGAKWEKPLLREVAAQKFHRIKRAGTFKAGNSIAQGSAAEQTKVAIVQLAEEGMLPLMQVYDEISISISNQAQARRQKEIMEHAIEFIVPSLAEVGIGPNWAEAKEMLT